MNLLRVLSVLCLVCYVACARTNVKSLTESMGQEVIEIGAPIKGLNELPPDLDEEPSAEVDDDDTTSTTTITPTTKKAIIPLTEGRRRGNKDIDKIDDREDEDARIEKELAEIYKDNLDYKVDTPEVTTQKKKEETKTTVTENVNDTAWLLEADDDKPIARSKANFKFQPDSTDKAAIERWRTSIDDITCDKASTSKLQLDVINSSRSKKATSKDPESLKFATNPQKQSNASRITLNTILLLASYYVVSAHG